jgi:hypothetical protein
LVLLKLFATSFDTRTHRKSETDYQFSSAPLIFPSVRKYRIEARRRSRKVRSTLDVRSGNNPFTTHRLVRHLGRSFRKFERGYNFLFETGNQNKGFTVY